MIRGMHAMFYSSQADDEGNDPPSGTGNADALSRGRALGVDHDLRPGGAPPEHVREIGHVGAASASSGRKETLLTANAMPEPMGAIVRIGVTRPPDYTQEDL